MRGPDEEDPVLAAIRNARVVVLTDEEQAELDEAEAASLGSTPGPMSDVTRARGEQIAELNASASGS